MSQYYDAFISYGRADSKAFATQLYQDLTKQGLKIWFDQNDIPLAVDFQNQIDDGIERAHNFLFIIAPHSVNSEYCLKEIELAVKYKKRIIPLLHVEQITKEIWQERNPGQTETDWEEYLGQGKHSSFKNIHPEISRINWVYFRENVDNYDEALAGLIELFHAETQHKQPGVTEDMLTFPSKKVQRRQKTLITAAALGTIAFLSGLSIVAWVQKLEAQRQSEVAFARQLAAESRTATIEGGFQQRGTLLAVESMRKFQKLNLSSTAADGALREGLSLLPNFVSEMNHDSSVTDVAFSPDGKYLATASSDTARVHFYKPEDLINEACRRLRRNLTVEEWERYMNLDLNQYHKTCDNLPVHPSVLAEGRELAEGGEIKEAEAIFRRVLKLEPDIDLDPDIKENDPETVARKLATDKERK